MEERRATADAFAGTTGVITGGAPGIGRASAEAFVAAGAHVVLLDCDASRLAASTAAVGSATAVHGDASCWEDCHAAAWQRDRQRCVDLRLHCSAAPLDLQRDQRRCAGGNRAAWEPVFGPQHMLCRVGEPAEVASVILFLCGPGTSFITGTDVLSMAVTSGWAMTKIARSRSPEAVT